MICLVVVILNPCSVYGHNRIGYQLNSATLLGDQTASTMTLTMSPKGHIIMTLTQPVLVLSYVEHQARQ